MSYIFFLWFTKWRREKKKKAGLLYSGVVLARLSRKESEVGGEERKRGRETERERGGKDCYRHPLILRMEKKTGLRRGSERKKGCGRTRKKRREKEKR